MARACPEKVTAGSAMSDTELALWENTTKKPDGTAAIQKANEMLYTTMALMTDDASEGGLAKNLAVDTGDIAIGDGFKLLQKFHDLFKQDASSMEDAEDLCEEVTSFKAIKNETVQVLVARFNALTTKLVGKSKTMKLPDIFLQTRFIRALTTTGVRNYDIPTFWIGTTEVNSTTWLNFRKLLLTKKSSFSRRHISSRQTVLSRLPLVRRMQT